MTIESAAEFVRLRRSSEPEEYHQAAHDSAPMEVWEEVIRSHPDMRWWVAQNKTVPLEILHVLARDEDARVRGMVARKRKLDEATLFQLAQDPEGSVRHGVACNANTPRAILEFLRNDPWHVVVEKAEERLVEGGGGDSCWPLLRLNAVLED